MALQFQGAPEWLIREYMNRRTPAEEASQGVQTALQGYLALDQSKRQNALAQRQMGLQEQQAALVKEKAAREGRSDFYQYGDPSGLQPSEQNALSFPRPEGPATAAGEVPQDSPIISYYRQFQQKYPQGLKGQEKEAAPSKFQQVPILIDGKPSRFNPTSGQYEVAQVVDPTNPSGSQPSIPTNPVFTPRVAPQVPAAQSAELGDFQNLLDQLKVVKSNYKPDYVGMVDSRTQGIKQATGIGADPQAATFKASLGAIRNKLLNLLSGAAISPAEYDRLLQQLPNEQSSEVDFNAKLNAFEQNIQGVIGSRQKSFHAAGYRSPTAAAPVSSPPPAAGGKIKISNGKETLLVDPSDVAEAAKEGFKVMR